MAGVNKVIIIGNLGADPEMKYLEGGSVIARFNLATSDSYVKNGEKITHTEWHKIELWDNLAKIAEQYLKKGDTAYIEGKIRTEEWQDKEGNNRTAVRIRANNLTLLGGRRNENQEQNQLNVTEKNQFIATKNPLEKPPIEQIPKVLVEEIDEDLPF